MHEDILEKLYANDQYLEYLRRHPKWYYYLDEDPKNYKLFEQAVKKDLKLTSFDKLERFKKQVNFASALVKYFSK